MAGKPDHKAAAIEAREEAGLRGRVSKTPIGRYRYDKIMADGSSIPCDVSIYPLLVLQEKNSWKEKGQRTRRWFSPKQAAKLVHEKDLAVILRQIAAEKGKIFQKLPMRRARKC